jgi:hypothetical protein
MEDSTKVFAVLAAVVLALAPVTNGVVREAAKTAERVFLEPADWTPPEDPPEPPPEDVPENLSDQNRTINASGAAAPSCNLTYPVAQGFQHQPIDEQPDRGAETQQKTFEVNGTHLGVRVGLLVTNMTGSLDARVYHEEAGDENAWFSESTGNELQETEVKNSGAIQRPTLETGTYVMQINHREITYDELTFVTQYVMCERAAGGSQ